MILAALSDRPGSLPGYISIFAITFRTLAEIIGITAFSTSAAISPRALVRHVFVPIGLFVDFFLGNFPGDLLVIAASFGAGVLRAVIHP